VATPGVKLNIDGAIDCRRRAAGTGMVAHDHLGLVLSGRCRCYEVLQGPFTVELLACMDAMEMAHECGFAHVMLETDCQTIVSKW
jgi:ribonuclease HI